MTASRIIQYIHRPTLTELGWGNTHDRYLVVDSDKDLSNVFPLGIEVNLLDTISNKTYNVYSKIETNEYRLKRLGDIVDDYHMEPGDEIVITHYELSDKVLNLLTVNECGRVLLNPGKRKNGKIEDFEIVNIEKLPDFSENGNYSYACEYNGTVKDIFISFSESRKKRTDSPSETKYYSVKFGQENLNYDSKKYYYLTIRDGIIVLRSLPKSDYRVLLEYRDSNNEISEVKNDLQVIYYGAPGTGKSHTINEITELQPKENVFRTTFHPDSDYSTFVGCYKPTKSKSGQNVKQAILDYDSLVDKFKEYLNVPNANITKVCTQFGFDYHDSIVRIQEQGRKVMDLVNDAYKSNTSYDSVVRGGMACYEQVSSRVSGSSITYEFVPQSFTKAYLRAWQTTEPVYLVIEEINRGNCAQIFGDLFQLLDRKCDGFSEYPIKADNDLASFIAENLSASIRTDIPDSVRCGEELSLPSNLYIWATMNTSDQSLFPIDSAFKRRWDWKYVPIVQGYDKKTGTLLEWKIKVGDKEYDWWKFLQAINRHIGDTTKSEDKKLGYFFCKAENGIISAETFVGKVLFYLWNDVYKDYDYNPAFFRDDNGQLIEYGEYYVQDASHNTIPNIELVKSFIEKVEPEFKANNSTQETDN